MIGKIWRKTRSVSSGLTRSASSIRRERSELQTLYIEMCENICPCALFFNSETTNRDDPPIRMSLGNADRSCTTTIIRLMRLEIY
jgi:hypothetical protein